MSREEALEYLQRFLNQLDKKQPTYAAFKLTVSTGIGGTLEYDVEEEWKSAGNLPHD